MATYAHKMVDGVEVALTPEEIAALEARDQEFETVQKPAQEAEKVRKQQMADDIAVRDLADRLSKATSAQIDAWFAANVNTAGQAIQVLKTMAKIFALKL